MTSIFLIQLLFCQEADFNLFYMGTSSLMTVCNLCLGNKQVGNGEYAYETFPRIPFFGPINDYIRMIKGFGGNQQGPGGSQFNLSNIISRFNQTTPSNGQIAPPSPQSPFSIASLFRNIPTDIITSQGDILNVDNSNLYVRKIKKSNYAQMSEKLKGSPDLYNDPEFPPNTRSIGNLQQETLNGITWKRIKDIIKDPIFIQDKVDPNDILQGSLGNCYFLSALSALAEQEYRIKNIFPNLQVSENGLYMARVLHNGILQEVVIDDYFPVKDGKPVFAQPAGGKQIWVMVLEKCWAKLFGSYANVVGGLPDEVLHAFTSAPVFYRSIGTNKDKQEALWKQMIQNFRAGSLLCCGTKSDATIQQIGFVLGHAYTILGVYDTPRRMIKLRNPWGHKQWKGPGSDFDEDFWNTVSASDKQKLDYADNKRRTNTDGVFFVFWEDFIKYFQLVDICKINDNANYNFIPASYQHLKPNIVEFQVGAPPANQAKNKVTFALTQENLRGKGTQVEDRGYSRSFLALGKLDESSGKYTYVNSNSAKTFPDNYMQVQDIKPGKYALYSKYLWVNGRPQNPATISTYSASPVVIKQKSSVNPQALLQDIFMDHASRNPKKRNINQKGDWICNDMLLNNGGFGYVVVYLQDGSDSKVAVGLKEMDYLQKKLELEQPYKGRGEILEEVSGGKPLIIIFSIPSETFPTNLSLPQPQIRKLA